MSSSDPHSGVRGRTRRAILSAAAAVLARDRTATLADIARAADVGRSTLHRYFADRDDLLRAVVADSIAAIDTAISDAAPEQGPPAEAVRRLVAGMVDVGDRVLFLFSDAHLVEELYPGSIDGPDQPVVDLIRRGQDEGVFLSGVPAEWLETAIWALVYTGCEGADRGVLPRHGVAQTVVHLLENGLHVRPPATAD
jgi:AcrR family transcriptional regulator